jgi:hypothetical protein
MRRVPADESGNAVLEFIVLTAFLMVPLIYLITAVFEVQGSAYGVTEATREAGRAYVEAGSGADAFDQACTAATVALSNQVSDAFTCRTQLKVICLSANGCASQLVPGDTIRVEIDLSVALPMLPRSVFGQPTTISLHSVHDEVVDAFRSAR